MSCKRSLLRYNGLRLSQLKGAVLEQQLPDLCVAQIVSSGERRVSIVEEPIALEVDNGFVRRPSLDGLQQRVLPVKRTVGLVSNSDFNRVRSACRVLEHVEAADLVERGGLEVAARAVCLHDFAVLVVDDELLGRGGERSEIGRQLSEAGPKRRARRGRIVAKQRFVLASRQLRHARLLCISTYQNIVVPRLQLTPPQPSKNHVVVAVVFQDRGVNAVRARNGVWLGLEFAVGLVGCRHADPEDALLVLGREEQVVHVGRLRIRRIRSPQLLARPWNVRQVQKLLVVSNKPPGHICPGAASYLGSHHGRLGVVGLREHIVVFHVVLLHCC